MTISSEHPFATPEGERNPVRRLRGRVGATVSLWTAGAGPQRVGLTVSSYLVADGDPARVLALVHPDADLLEGLDETGSAVLQLLEWRHRDLAEAFAGLFPAPGGPFRMAQWEQTDWGPRLVGAGAWAGVRLDRPGTGPRADAGGSARAVGRPVGWSVLVEGVIEHVVIGQEEAPLVHRRGRYQRPPR
ncbi:MAG TPA: flavin reductase [Intrasporangium sp.]|uniref:flavin reductase family protein n=1 Tax=Intrasporangium sp. TaxID=1925024 RepID=UPI002D769694|nr:flavin reductase [Intrasporangium sp.]HET7399065.1 flavin reductase [Intrasporangium sp.]